MQKRVFAIIVIFSILFIFSSCGKYEEGPFFSILPKKSRIANTWQIEKVYINDVDATNINQAFHNSVKLALLKDGSLTMSYTNSLGSFTDEGTWELESSAERLIFNISNSETFYKILRLKNKEMWLENYINDVKYEVHYVSYKE